MTLKYPMVRFHSRRCRIYRLRICKRVRHLIKSVWDTTLKYPMVRLHSRRFRIQRLHICKEVRYLPPTSVLHMTLEYSMVRLESRRKYTDCTSAEFLDIPKSVQDIILNILGLRLNSWSVGECGVHLHCYCSQVKLDNKL